MSCCFTFKLDGLDLVWVFTGFIQPSIALLKTDEGHSPLVCILVCVPLMGRVALNTFLFQINLSGLFFSFSCLMMCKMFCFWYFNFEY